MSKRTLVKNLASVGIIQVANYIFPMISIPIISRVIGPEKFGVINFATSFISYFTLLIGFGFDMTATRRVAADPENAENRNTVFSEVFYSQLFLLAISTIWFTISLYCIPQLRAEKQVALYTFIICFSTLFTQNWLFQAMQDLPKVAILNLVSKIVYTGLVLSIIKNRSDYIWQPLALSLSQIVAAILSFTWALKRYKLQLYRTRLVRCLRLMWSEKQFFLSLCFINIYTATNVVVLEFVKNSHDVGIYTAGERLITIIKAIVLIPFTQAFFPFVAKAFGSSFDNGLNILQRVLPISIFFMSLTTVGIFIFCPLFISFFYGAEFKQATEVCQILSAIPLLVCLNTLLGIHLFMNLKMDRYFLLVTGINSAIGVSSNFLFSKYFSFHGPALTWVLIEFLNAVAFTFITIKIKRIPIFKTHYFSIGYNLGLIKAKRKSFLQILKRN